MQNTKTFKKILGGGMAAATLAGGAIVAQAPAAFAQSDWDRLAECEANGDWSINTGNGFYGGLQFTESSWQAAGGTGMPHEASKAEQISVAENLLEMQGWGAWPSCSAQLGLSGQPDGSPTPDDAGAQEQAPAEQEAPVQEAPVQEAPTELSEETYTIQEGDSLAKIADELGIDDWQDLWGANADQIEDPNTIFVGDELKLPVL